MNNEVMMSIMIARNGNHQRTSITFILYCQLELLKNKLKLALFPNLSSLFNMIEGNLKTYKDIMFFFEQVKPFLKRLDQRQNGRCVIKTRLASPMMTDCSPDRFQLIIQQ